MRSFSDPKFMKNRASRTQTCHGVIGFFLCFGLFLLPASAISKPSVKAAKFECDIQKRPFLDLEKLIHNASNSGEPCELLADSGVLLPHGVNGLSHFWAMEYTGADLVRDELKPELLQRPVPPEMIEVWDGDLSGHNEQVSNLITGPSRSAVIYNKEPNYQYTPVSDELSFERAVASHQKHGEEHIWPSVVNISMRLNGGDAIKRRFDVLVNEKQTVVVAASGNDGGPLAWSEPVKNEMGLNKKIVIVGSTSFTGAPSSFTTFGESLAISAPSNDELITYNHDQNLAVFGRTSGAAPQVTGALGVFTYITKARLSSEDALRLLEKTALPIPGLPTPSRAGAGMLNTYRLFAVARRIRDMCGEKKDPKETDACVHGVIRTDDVFRFSGPNESLAKQVREAFPDCSGLKGVKSTLSCDEREKAFKALRSQAFLNPEESPALKDCDLRTRSPRRTSKSQSSGLRNIMKPSKRK
jgi:hypothetical protein